MLKASAKTGGGVEIGDIITSYRDVLPNGKRLVPTNKIDKFSAVEYPDLAAAIGQTLGVVDAFAIQVNTDEVLVPDNANIGTSFFKYGQTDNNFNVEVRRMTKGDTTAGAILDTTNVALSGFCQSDDGQEFYWYSESQSSTPATRIVNKTVNGGSTISTVAVGTNNGARNNYSWETAMQCDPTGTNITIMYFDDASPNTMEVYKSTNSGTSWAKDTTMSMNLTTAGGLVQWCHVSRDLNQTLFFESDGSTTGGGYKLWRSRAGAAHVNITANYGSVVYPAFTESGSHALAWASDDGQTILIQLIAEANNNNYNGVGVKLSPANRTAWVLSTDGGDTFTDISFTLPEPKGSVNSIRTYPVGQMSSDGAYFFYMLPNDGQSGGNVGRSYLYEIATGKIREIILPANLGIPNIGDAANKALAQHNITFYYDGTFYWLHLGRGIGTSEQNNINSFKLEKDYWWPGKLASPEEKIVVDPA